MSKDILYYPTIEFQKYDYKWLWSASLLWDKIYRIVPDGYKLNEPRNIKELCSTNEIGIPLSPNRYSKTVSKDFIDKLDSIEWRRVSALQFNHEDIEAYEKYSRLHKDKVDVALQNLLLINTDSQDIEEWLYVPQQMANIYMTYLAKHIASNNNLSLHTHDTTFWTSSSYFLYDDQMQDHFFPNENFSEPSHEALISILIKDLMPLNLLDITPETILRFREKRRDERVHFINAIDEFKNKLTKVQDPKIIQDLIIDEQSKVEYALNDYKKSMDILNATRWSGHLLSLGTIAVDALGYVPFSQNTLQALTSAGIGIGIITGLIENNASTVKDTPYSYLTNINSISPYEYNEYNYKLYRKFEEFIND